MRKTSGTDRSLRWVTPIKGATISAFSAVVMSALGAMLIIGGYIHENRIPHAVIPILGISAFMGVKCNRRMPGENGGRSSYLTGIVFLLLILFMSAVVGSPHDRTLTKALSIASGTVLGCIGGDRKRRGKVPIKRRSNR